MYSPSFTERQIDALAAALHWTPEHHTVEQVEAANAHFESITKRDDHGENAEWERPLDAAEAAWIQNEILLCKADFRYFSSRYCFISDKSNQVVRFTANLAQLIALAVMGRMEERRVAVILLFLKARQLGVSTLAELLVLHRVVFTPGLKSVLGSSDPKRSLKLFRMFRLAFERLPWWMRPTVVKFSEGDHYEYSHGGFLDITWGNKKTGIARGDTPTVGHLTEVAEFENAEEKIDEALVRAMHEDPSMLLVVESTANGLGDWLNTTWEESVAGMADGSNYYFPLFLAWYVGRDIYPTEARLRRQPVPENWEVPEYVRKHADAAAENVASDPLLSEILGVGWTMPVEQMWYYHVEYQRAKNKKRLAGFLKEMPATPLEAFSTPHGGLFDAETVILLQNAVRPPVGVYAVEGPGVQLPTPPHEIDRAKRELPRERGGPFSVTVNWSRRFRPLVYNFVPLLYAGAQTYNFNNKVAIYEWPEAGEDYVAGGDIGHGRGADSTVLNFARQWSAERLYREQVAVWGSNQVSASDAWPYALAVGTLYSALRGERRRQCKSAREIPMGDPLIADLIKYGWWNLHRRISKDSLKPNYETGSVGVSVDKWSRTDLVSGLMRDITDGEYRVNHLPVFRDMAGLVWNEEKKRVEAKPGSHDDYFFACAYDRESARQFDSESARESKYEEEKAQRAAGEALPEYDPGDFGRIRLDEDGNLEALFAE